MKSPEEKHINKKSIVNIEKIRNGEVFVVSGKTEEELIDLAIKIFLRIEDITYPDEVKIQSDRCKEELFSGDKELRPMGYAIYLEKGKLHVDSRNHRNDDGMKAKLEKILLEMIS